MTSSWEAQAWTLWSDRNRNMLYFQFGWPVYLNNPIFSVHVGEWWGRQESRWVGDSHTHLHTLSVHSPVFHRLCCTSYSPLSSPSACSQICDSSVRSSDIQVPVCLPLPHSSPGPVGPSQLQNGAGPPKNSVPVRRGFNFTGHTKPSARAFLMKILKSFYWCVVLQVEYELV